jgi:hypothetical protein
MVYGALSSPLSFPARARAMAAGSSTVSAFRSTRGPLLSAEGERARLRAHFACTLDLLRTRTPSACAGRRRERGRLLRELERYARREAFPRNRAFPGLSLPIFVDDRGNRCAVGHLMEVSGAGADVARVRDRSNLARVAELAAALAPWADAVGISLEEAALIQPGYCFVTPAYECLCGQLPPLSGVLEGEIVITGSPAVLRVDTVHGEAPHAIGDEVEVYTGADLGSLALVPVDEDGASSEYSTIVLGANGELACSELVAPRETVIEAMLADSCNAVLEQADPAWTASPCDDPVGCAIGVSVHTLKRRSRQFSRSKRRDVRRGRGRGRGRERGRTWS